MGFSKQQYWSGLPFPSPGDLPDPGIEPGSPELQACSLLSEPPGKLTGQLQTKNLMVFGRFEHKHLNKRELDLDALLSCGPGITEFGPNDLPHVVQKCTPGWAGALSLFQDKNYMS